MAKATMKIKKQDDLVDKAARLTLDKKVLYSIGVFVALVLLFYVLAYLPYASERTSLVSIESSLQTSITGEQAKLRRHKSLDAYQEGIETAYQYIENFLPQENEIPKLVQIVSEIGAKAGLTDGVTSLALTLPAQVKENYAEIPFTMKLQGEYLAVLKFLYNFSRMTRIINITDFSISSPKMIDAQREIHHISVTSSGSTYRTLSEEEMIEQAQRKKKK